eukprot:754927-Pyramimonas_sp.AAC.1
MDHLVRCRPSSYKRLGKDKGALTFRTKKRPGSARRSGWGTDKEWVTGGKSQKPSQAYPGEFTRAVAGIAWGSMAQAARDAACV